MRRTFYESMLEMVEGDEAFFYRLVFSDKTTIYLCVTIVTTCAFEKLIIHMKQLSIKDILLKRTFTLLYLKSKSMVAFSLKKTPLQDKAIWKCFKTGYFLYCNHIRMTSFFSKMQHHPIGISRFQLI